MEYGHSMSNRIIGAIVGTMSVGFSLLVLYYLLWGQ